MRQTFYFRPTFPTDYTKIFLEMSSLETYTTKQSKKCVLLSFYAVWRELQLFLTEIFPRKQFDNNGFIDVSVEGQNGFQVQWVILPVFSTL